MRRPITRGSWQKRSEARSYRLNVDLGCIPGTPALCQNARNDLGTPHVAVTSNATVVNKWRSLMKQILMSLSVLALAATSLAWGDAAQPGDPQIAAIVV